MKKAPNKQITKSATSTFYGIEEFGGKRKDLERTICDRIDERYAQGAAKKAAEKATAETEQKSKLEDIHSFMETLNFTLQQAMDALKIPVEKQAEYRALI